MIAVTLSLLLAFTQVESAPVNKQLPAPNLAGLVLFDPAGLIINWKPIEVNQKVEGYKVKIWEAKREKIYRYKTVNGTEVHVEELETPELSLSSSHDCKLYEYMVRGADQSRLVLNDIQPGTPYYIQVLAFNAEGDGEPSSKVGVQRGSTNESVAS